MNWLPRFAVLVAVIAAIGAQAQTSDWAKIVNGTLTYKTLPAGDHIMDFSWAGYAGGGVAIPTPTVVRTVHPSGGDDTARIQGAIDAVQTMPLLAGFEVLSC